MILVIAVLVGIIVVVFDTLKLPLLLFLSVLIIYIAIKEYKNRKSFRNPFKKIEQISECQYVLMMIDQSKLYKKYITDNNNILLLTEKDIYFIKVLDYKNKIFGNINDICLYEEKGNKKNKIINKVKNYNNEYDYYKNIIKKDIKKYLVIRNDCNMSLDDKSIKIIHNKNLLFEIDKTGKKYTPTEIDNFCKVLSKKSKIVE